MFKHWVMEHRELLIPPKLKFSVIQKFKDPLSRIVKEAVSIQDQFSLNSKSELRSYRVDRLTVEKQDWQVKRDQKLKPKQRKICIRKYLNTSKRLKGLLQLSPEHILMCLISLKVAENVRLEWKWSRRHQLAVLLSYYWWIEMEWPKEESWQERTDV